MPTDGADFGRTRPCYGRAYTMARDGADNADVAECVMRGVELDIRRDGGAPAFTEAVDLVVAACRSANGSQLLAGVDATRQKFVDSPLTRHIAEAAAKTGLAGIAAGNIPSREQAARELLVRIGASRCCDGMTGYVARHRTKNNVREGNAVVGDIKARLGQTFAVKDLANRMLNCSQKGLPARVPKAASVSHSADGLNEEL